jgi:methylated-DNA-[protein]-cysteine S-methyltransferase
MTTTLVLTRDQLATPVGTLYVVTDAAGVVRALDWLDFEERMLRLLGLHYRSAFSLQVGAGPASVRTALGAYFEGDVCALAALPVATGGSAFQREVWAALRRIPVGATWSYGQLAQDIGKPKAVRAVGLANGANPISVIVPCHRVIGAGGALTGYAGGIARKRWLLEHEGVQLSAAATRPRAAASRAASATAQPEDPRAVATAARGRAAQSATAQRENASTAATAGRSRIAPSATAQPEDARAVATARRGSAASSVTARSESARV